MKTFLTSVLLCAFLQVVWFSTGQTDSALNCPEFNGNYSLCCGAENASCVFFQCSQSDSNGTCVASGSIAPKCPGSETPTAVCNAPASSTANPAETCSKHSSNQTACCEVDECGFFTCNSSKNAESDGVCAQKDSTTACAAGEQSNNTCQAVPTTTPPVTTTPPADSCASYNNNKTECCAAASTEGCIFYMCPGQDKNTTMCRSNTTTGNICPAGSAKPVNISCTEITTTPPPTTPGKTTDTPKPTGPPTSQSPTKAPSGGGGGGRHFDGASFIGGIVLCAGIVAIGYFGLKFYKSRQERNYHTL